MPNKNLAILPRFRYRTSYLYLEKGRIEKFEKSIAYHYLKNLTPVPVENMAFILLGPGTTVTHEAICKIAEARCLLGWVGEHGVRFYSSGYTGSHSSRHLLTQAKAYSNPDTRLRICRDMYQYRFSDPLPAELTIQQLRGREGARVRNLYKELSEKYGIKWTGRYYNQDNWNKTDPVNRALSAANACLYGLVHSAILSAGLSPAIGFIHTGKQLSFVYDVADLYKTETSMPVAFLAASRYNYGAESFVRKNMRDIFKQTKLMKRIIPDMLRLLYGSLNSAEYDSEPEGKDIAINVGT